MTNEKVDIERKRLAHLWESPPHKASAITNLKNKLFPPIIKPEPWPLPNAYSTVKALTPEPISDPKTEFVSRLYWCNRTFLIRIPASVVKIESMQPSEFYRFAIVRKEADK